MSIKPLLGLLACAVARLATPGPTMKLAVRLPVVWRAFNRGVGTILVGAVAASATMRAA